MEPVEPKNFEECATDEGLRYTANLSGIERLKLFIKLQKEWLEKNYKFPEPTGKRSIRFWTSFEEAEQWEQEQWAKYKINKDDNQDRDLRSLKKTS